MELILGRGEYSRDRGKFVPWRQENCFLEKTATDPNQYNILSRPPLASFYSWGSGPVHGIFQRPGLFSGAVFAIIGGTLYKDGVSLGAINGSGPAWFAAGIGELCCGKGQSAYSYNGTNLAAIAFPDGADVRSGNYMARRFVFVRKGSGRFYWSAVDNGRTIDGLNYATAESEADDLLDILRIGDTFLPMGQNSIETWVLTGDPDLPWTRVVQRTVNGRGIQDTGCGQEIEGTVYFISSDSLVCMWQQTAVRISDSALEEKIRLSSTGSTYWFEYEGKPIFCMRLDDGTYGLDLAMANQVVKLSTSGRTNWAPKSAVNVGGEVLFGDDTAGTVWVFDTESETDSGEDEFRRVFTAGLPLNEQPFSITNIIADGDSGSTNATTGAAADPLLAMRFSRDGGRTWSTPRASRWGAQGEYKRKARFGSCGMFGPPGFLAELSMEACAPLRIASVRANESLAGRGR
jgi:hypothetical protein